MRVEADSQHVKHEFLGGLIFAIAGDTPEHARLAAAMIASLGHALRGKGCTVYSSDLRVRIDPLDVTTYPDVSVVCGPPRYSSVDPNAVVNPTLLALLPQILRCQIDRRDSHTATQPDRTGEFLVSAQHGWPGVAAILTEQTNSDGLADWNWTESSPLDGVQ